MEKKISIIGMGRLGLPFSAVFASYNYKVIGIDNNPDAFQKIKNKSYLEPYLDELLQNYGNNIIFSTSIALALKESDITFIVVPTPSNRDGSFSLEYIFQVCSEIGLALKNKKKFHTVVITSTISPGSIEIIKNKLEEISLKKIKIDFGLCYSPEFIALGNTIENFQHPDFILIGQSDKKSGRIVAKHRKNICKNNPQVLQTNSINAEIAKLALNTYITTKISFSNMIARISEKTPGANVDIITNIIGSDSRIGNKYLMGGVAYGGPCFPRDNKALSSFIKKINLNITIPKTIDEFNKNQNDILYSKVKQVLKKRKTVGILGITYKQNTDVLDESVGLVLANNLIKDKKNVVIYDPSIRQRKISINKKIHIAKSLEEGLNNSDVVIITTPWDEFKTLPLEIFSKNSHKYLIDCWRIFSSKDTNDINYIGLGMYNPL